MRSIVLLVLMSLPAAANDWPKFRGPNGNNTLPDAEIITSFPDTGPKVLWSIDVSEGYGGAAIVGGEVFAMDRVDQEKDVLLCLDLADGSEKWHWEHEVRGRISHPGSRVVPTVTDNAIYTSGGFGHVYCIDRETREPRWIVDVAKVFNAQPPRFGYSIHPVVLEDKVIIAPTSDEVGMAALDKQTGEVVWRSEPLGNSHSSPYLVEMLGREMLSMPGSRGDTLLLNLVDPADGSLIHQYQQDIGSGLHHSIPNLTVVDRDTAFLTAGYGQGTQVLEFSESDGKIEVELSHQIGAGSTVQPVLIVDERAYLSAGRAGGGGLRNRRGPRPEGGEPGRAATDGLICMDLEGKVLWSTDEDPAFGEGSIISIGGIIVSQDGADGTLRLIEPGDTYKELAKGEVFTKETGRELWAPLAFSDGRLVMRSQFQTVCVDLSPEE